MAFPSFPSQPFIFYILSRKLFKCVLWIFEFVVKIEIFHINHIYIVHEASSVMLVEWSNFFIYSNVSNSRLLLENSLEWQITSRKQYFFVVYYSIIIIVIDRNVVSNLFEIHMLMVDATMHECYLMLKLFLHIFFLFGLNLGFGMKTTSSFHCVPWEFLRITHFTFQMRMTAVSMMMIGCRHRFWSIVFILFTTWNQYSVCHMESESILLCKIILNFMSRSVYLWLRQTILFWRKLCLPRKTIDVVLIFLHWNSINR